MKSVAYFLKKCKKKCKKNEKSEGKIKSSKKRKTRPKEGGVIGYWIPLYITRARQCMIHACKQASLALGGGGAFSLEEFTDIVSCQEEYFEEDKHARVPEGVNQNRRR